MDELVARSCSRCNISGPGVEFAHRLPMCKPCASAHSKELERARYARYRKTDKRKAVLSRFNTSASRRAYMREYMRRENFRANLRRYAKTPRGKEIIARSNAMRRAIIWGSGKKVTADDWRDILALFHNACAYCGCIDKPLTRDHVIPLSRGGSHTRDNIVPACISCNASKGARLIV